ncbi:TetR/AcrR family transcriptional regulator [Vibrio metschnikovii]|uniref:TetR/AcrR family transcriptional regulator n=1 Tax=Vibrio metschnikovii TaxID=28172 RepID=UPI00242E2B35|nr:TetR/AcrR family transcriptional regulator [Vibrio metschnikovii]EKO3925816.1 TetR/AcrR family transcriptional regulator [Vibrio metschnikovii]ELF5344630.1 TetR/AcrR family transcriptional regulator [Vibrio metschnikovii]MDM7484795.1 TetR/AcrR family transcriptional regulator [Vibrio metschnikovii]
MKVTEQKRLALIEAAKEEFTAYGFNAANMDRVCEKAATSKRTLYRHFESKELLFTAAINSMVEQQTLRPSFVYQSDVTLESQLKTYLTRKVAGLYRDIGLPVVRMIIGEFIREPELAKKYLALMGDKDLELKRWLDVAIEEGRLCHGDSQTMLTTLLNLFHGQFLWPQLVANLSQPTLEQQECYLEEIVRIFLCAYAHDKHEQRL